MKRSSLALLTSLFLAPLAAYAQSVARVGQLSRRPDEIENEGSEEVKLASRSMFALKRIEKDVLIYRSLGEFQANGKLARVSYEAFRNDLNEVTSEVEPMLSRLPHSKLKIELGNALASYREGEFWWRQIDQPRVVNLSSPPASTNGRKPSDTARLSTVPYTVATHWRQANRSLKRAAQLMNQPGN